MSVSIVGAGPAGCAAGIYLARNGFNVKMYDRDLTKVKPCGGALSWRVEKHFKEFLENVPSYPIKDVLFDFENKIIETSFSRNIGVVTDRFVFDRNLRGIAESEGIKIEKKERDPKKIKDDFVIDARGCVERNKPAVAIKCLCKKRNQKMLFVFKREMIRCGYFWIFPTPNNLVNAGVGSFKMDSGENLIDALNWFLKKYDLNAMDMSASPVFCGGDFNNSIENGIIKVGERAGLVNPATGEGVYYALKSGKIAADCIIENKVPEYESLIKGAFQREFQISKKVRSLLVKLPVPMARSFFGFGLNYLKSKVEKNSDRAL